MKRIDHIGIAVPSIEEAIPFYRDVLGLEMEGEEVVEGQQVRVAFFAIGGSRIELLEPTSDRSPIAAFLRKRGAGIHHIAYECADLDDRLESLAREGVRLIDRRARRGAHGMRIAFLHPKGSGGVLTELCEGSGPRGDAGSADSPRG
ncbi:MAG: methylmalonyl-CoA epimerase [Gemmatimonadetes bacterium]|nr:methylmalonyl-CoA epimerase [Gemmatimonadota bacterium]